MYQKNLEVKMKNAKKILLFLGAVTLIAFGNFNLTVKKPVKETKAQENVAEGTENKDGTKKIDAVAEAVDESATTQVQENKVTEVENTAGAVVQNGQQVQAKPAKKSSAKKQTKQTKVPVTEVKENIPAEVAPVKEAAPKVETPKAETKTETKVKVEAPKTETKQKEKSSSSN